MKRVALICCTVVLLLSLFPARASAKVDRYPGGATAFLVGCCWGIREGSEWNEGADMHWREWAMVVPVVNVVVGIWNGLDCYNGITAREWAEKNGANWY